MREHTPFQSPQQTVSHASFLLQELHSKAEVDSAIMHTADLVLVLRFGRCDDPACMVLDDLVRSSVDLLRFNSDT